MPQKLIPHNSNNKTLLVLGAKSDIAQAIAREFAKHGFDLILAARNHESLRSTQSDLTIRHQINVEIVEFDAENFASHHDFYRALKIKPDVVVCAFGYLGEQTAAQRDLDETLRIANVNYVGAISILNVVAEDFAVREHGAIIGISSVAGERGRQSNYLYGSAKAGFSTYLDGLRHRLKKSNVHVVTVKPGFVQTKMTAEMNLPKALTAQPAQIAAHVFRAYVKRQNTLYSLAAWRYIMLIVRSLPESVFLRTKL